MDNFYILYNIDFLIILGKSGCLLPTNHPTQNHISLSSQKLTGFKNPEARAISTWMKKWCVHTHLALCGQDITVTSPRAPTRLTRSFYSPLSVKALQESCSCLFLNAWWELHTSADMHISHQQNQHDLAILLFNRNPTSHPLFSLLLCIFFKPCNSC